MVELLAAKLPGTELQCAVLWLLSMLLLFELALRITAFALLYTPFSRGVAVS